MMNYFSDEELQCPCCKKLVFDSSFLHKLNNARFIADIPFVITSGYRCADHNKKVGGSPTSSHLKGLAVDIAIKTSRERFKILHGLICVGLIRIGIGPDFIHVDDSAIFSDKPQNVIWTYYPKENK